ncbi:CBS domain-containing protein [Vreelandella alkaliphila]|uniref:Cystathionine beta-synthase, core n=1 Tax=Vreelandella alkaliphila TaxID=272774 RepID=A0ABX4HH28_9GAMM|nr:CBS domain-containing protein [Halomonas humidisoli]PAU71774.1 cystathionine beta-synthase, core [Halomonas humidisoli]
MNMLVHSPKPLIQFGETPLLITPTAKQLTPESPASSVLTDFTQVTPQSVSADTPIDDAHLKMRHGGVRLLFVLDKANHCIGVLTAKEVIGTRRINLAMQQRNLDRTEITADMIMTPWQKLSAMPFEQLNSLTIEDLVLSMERFTEQHLLITEHKQNQPLSVRGIISATDIQHAMGNKTTMQATSSAVPTASSFADICKVITGHDL